jgi:CIC family chloride channel protein
LCSILVGIVAGLAAVVMKVLVHFIQQLLQTGWQAQYQNYLFFIYPILGILLTVTYIKFIHKGAFVKGVSPVLYSIARKASNIDKENMYAQTVTSSITVGFGGSVGLEAPIVLTGSAIGSNVAKTFKLSYKERTLLLACGAAAGIAAVFNCPIAGVIFAVEVLLSEFTIPAFIPLLIATATASVISRTMYSGQLFFLITTGWHMNAIPFYIALALLTGLLSVYITRTTLVIEEFFQRKKNIYGKAAWGGILLGILIFVLPPLYGEGYEMVEHLLSGHPTHLLDNSLFFARAGDPWFVLLFAGAIILVKVIASCVTVGAGGNGGMFAPSLFIGALTGFFFAQLINLLGIAQLTVPNFIVAGMAGALSGVIHAPLTAIFLIAEITGGYVLFIPLMMVSAISYFFTRYFEPYSIYTKRLAQRGHLITADKDKNVLNKLKLKNLIETDFIPVRSSATLGELVNLIAHSRRNIFPVVDKEGRLRGIVLLDDIREIMFNQDLYDKTFVRDIMTQPPAKIKRDDNMHRVMEKFEDNNAWNLPVVEDGKYIGFVSKSNIFTRYRELLIRQSQQIA